MTRSAKDQPHVSFTSVLLPILVAVNIWFTLGGLAFWPCHYCHGASLPTVVEVLLTLIIISVAYAGMAHPFVIGLLWGILYRKRASARTLWFVAIAGLIVGTISASSQHATWTMVVRYILPDVFIDLGWAGATMLIGALLGALPYLLKVAIDKEKAEYAKR